LVSIEILSFGHCILKIAAFITNDTESNRPSLALAT
jgi:hypothetical protein